jgi:hypothetical protein
MAVDQMIRKVQDALKLSKLKAKLSRSPKIVDIRAEDYVDTDGEDALRAWVIIDEDVDVEKVDGDDVSAVVRAIHDRVRELGIERWPYVWFAKQSELDEEDDEGWAVHEELLEQARWLANLDVTRPR